MSTATCIAGCPPDEFSATVSFGGNPLHDWEAMDKDATNGGLKRLRESFEIPRQCSYRPSSVFRIHLGKPWLVLDTAAPGEWSKVLAMLAAVKEELGELNIIAEDLGFMTDEVITV